MTQGRLLSLGAATGRPRWLLEMFEVGESSLVSKHAVWLRRHDSSWHWWCCCGVRQEGADLVGVLCAARMHFDSFPDSPVPTPVAHPLAAWSRISDPAGDDRAVMDLAGKLLEAP